MGGRMMMRASDRDRQEAVDRLRGAVADGRLTLAEFEGRMGLAYTAVTYGDLDPLCADLPAPGPLHGGQAGVPAVAGPARRRLPGVLRVAWTAWGAAVSVNVVVWALVSGTTAHLAYPWPLWVAGPWGAVLAALSAAAMAGRRARPAAVSRGG